MWSHFRTCGMIRESKKLNDKIEKSRTQYKKKQTKITRFLTFRNPDLTLILVVKFFLKSLGGLMWAWRVAEYSPKICLWHRIILNCLFLRNCRHWRSSKKQQKLFFGKGNLHLQRKSPFVRASLFLCTRKTKSQETLIKGEGTDSNLCNKPYPCYSAFPDNLL